MATIFGIVNSSAQDLRIDVIPVQRRFGANDGVNVILQYSNLGTEPISLYRWNYPENELNDPLFRVTLYGMSVDYVGPLIKRGEPTNKDLIELAPGSTISTTIDISLVYDMSETGRYVIQFHRMLGQLMSTDENDNDDSIPSLYAPENIILVSPRVVVFVVGRPNPLAEDQGGIMTNLRALQPIFTKCDDSQIDDTTLALDEAQNYAENATDYFNTEETATLRYTTWFGAYSPANWKKLTGDYSRILAAIVEQTLTFDCSCPIDNPENTFAFVYPTQPYTIYLCGSFWTAPIAGSNSKAGTIIHELAHFKIIAGTDDITYGEESAKKLAKTNPAKAVDNSDNIEFFAENTPPLS